MEFAAGGRAVRVQTQGQDTRGGGGDRVAITGFSARSRRQLLRHLRSIDREQAPADEWAFVTLTYHREGVTARESKSDLRKLVKRMERRFKGVAGFWKIEPQERGTPHHHLLLRIESSEDREAVRAFFVEHWHAIADPNSPEHLRCLQFRAFSREHERRDFFQRLDSWDHIEGYVGKYMGKLVSSEQRALWKFPGRFWGIIAKARLPVSVVRVPLSKRAACLVRRMLRRAVGSRETGRVEVVAKSATPGQPGRRFDVSHLAKQDRRAERSVFGPPPGAVAMQLAMVEMCGPWRSVKLVRRRYKPKSGGDVMQGTMDNSTLLRLVQWAVAQAPRSADEAMDVAGRDVDRWLEREHQQQRERSVVASAVGRAARSLARRKQLDAIAAGALLTMVDRIESRPCDLFAKHPWVGMPRKLSGQLVEWSGRERVGRAKHAPAAAGVASERTNHASG